MDGLGFEDDFSLDDYRRKLKQTKEKEVKAKNKVDKSIKPFEKKEEWQKESWKEPSIHIREKYKPNKYFRSMELDQVLRYIQLSKTNIYQQIYSLRTAGLENWICQNGIYQLPHLSESEANEKNTHYSSFGFVNEFNWEKTNPNDEFTDIFYFHSLGKIYFTLQHDSIGREYEFIQGNSIVVAPATSIKIIPYEQNRPFLMRILRIPRNDRIYFDNDLYDILQSKR